MAATQTSPATKRRRASKRARREELILAHMGLVKQVLGRVAAHLPPYVDREDLLEAGMMGLVEAAGRFDPERKVKFSTYAATRIRGAMLDALRDEDWLPRSARNELSRIDGARSALEHEKNGPAGAGEVSRRLKMPEEKVRRLHRMAAANGFQSLDEVPSGLIDPGDNRLKPGADVSDLPVERAVFEEQRQRLAAVIAELPERERLVISLYYFEQLNLREIAEVMGVTNSRVCQLHRAALRRMQRTMGAGGRHPLAAAG
jgi:RNA polymerase sigma factor for flagellar operon FliA